MNRSKNKVHSIMESVDSWIVPSEFIKTSIFSLLGISLVKNER